MTTEVHNEDISDVISLKGIVVSIYEMYFDTLTPTKRPPIAFLIETGEDDMDESNNKEKIIGIGDPSLIELGLKEGEKIEIIGRFAGHILGQNEIGKMVKRKKFLVTGAFFDADDGAIEKLKKDKRLVRLKKYGSIYGN